MSDNSIITKIKDKATTLGREIAFQLATGMQKVNNEAFSGYGRNVGDGHELTVNRQAETNRVAKALLQGEQTQAVKELAYRTALVEEESKDFEYLSESLALRYEDKYYNVKKANFDDSDNRKVLFVQQNRISDLSILNSIKEIGMCVNMNDNASNEEVLNQLSEEFDKSKTTVEENGNKKDVYDLGKINPKLKGESLIKVTTNTVARFQIAEKIQQIVVKEGEEEGKVYLDIYFNKYPLRYEWTSKPFVKELERIIFKGFRSSILDINGISFITSKANGVKDNLKFGFLVDRYVSGGEYEGWYMLKFEAKIAIDGEDIMAPLYCESMAEKYRTKAKKDYVMHLSPHTFNRSYVCEECGKIVELNMDDILNMKTDETNINDLESTSATDLDENGEFHTSSNVLSYYDMEIIEQTFGKKLCNDCFRKLANQMSNNTKEILNTK